MIQGKKAPPKQGSETTLRGGSTPLCAPRNWKARRAQL